jgi:hypothetical protein
MIKYPDTHRISDPQSKVKPGHPRGWQNAGWGANNWEGAVESGQLCIAPRLDGQSTEGSYMRDAGVLEATQQRSVVSNGEQGDKQAQGAHAGGASSGVLRLLFGASES